MAKKQNSKEVVVSQPQGVSVAPQAAIPVDALAWGMDQKLTAQDILIPRLLAMQPGSKLVVAEEAKFGELRNSVTKQMHGNLQQAVEFIPFYMQKTFVVMRKEKKSAKFLKEVPITPELENQPYEVTTPEGLEYWYRNYNFYVLLVEDIKAGKSLPVVLSFRSSSQRSGKNLATQMYTMNLRAGKSPAAQVMKVIPVKTTNDDGTFAVLNVEPVRPSTEAEVQEAFNWVKVVCAGNIRVDEAVEEEAARAEQSVPNAPESTDY